MKKISIVITDDHALIREAWRTVLNCDPRFLVVADCGSGKVAIDLIKKFNPDIVIMDVAMEEMDGIETTSIIKKLSPTTKVLGVSSHIKPDVVKNMINNGARGYVTKSSPSEELFKAIIELSEGRKYICTEIKNLLADEMMNSPEEITNINLLTKREEELITYIKNGFSSKEIASKLFISVKTVQVHQFNIFKKLKLKNSIALLNFINSR